MSIIPLVVLLSSAGAVGASTPGTRSYLAAGSHGLDPFDAFVERGRIVRLGRATAGRHAGMPDAQREAFAEGRALHAVARDGRRVAVKVRALDPDPEQYERAIRLDVDTDEVLLAASGGVPPTALASPAAALTAQEGRRIRGRARAIWAAETARLDAAERPTGRVTLGAPRSVSVPGAAGIVAVNVPASFERHGVVDDRGGFFFLLDHRSGAIILARFGHPEWSPDAPASVVRIEPILFFRMADGAPTYMLAVYQSGWESDGLGILDPVSGRVVGVTEQRGR